jgi:hypothetical protein
MRTRKWILFGVVALAIPLATLSSVGTTAVAKPTP